MVTESTNTVYVCAECGAPARVGKWDIWEHFRPGPCHSLTVTTVTLPVPTRG